MDYKRFIPNKGPLPGTLWIAEQIPGYVERYFKSDLFLSEFAVVCFSLVFCASISADVTNVWCAQGYWPSYNIPYFPSIYNRSGYIPLAAQNAQYSYSTALVPRFSEEISLWYVLLIPCFFLTVAFWMLCPQLVVVGVVAVHPFLCLHCLIAAL